MVKTPPGIQVIASRSGWRQVFAGGADRAESPRFFMRPPSAERTVAEDHVGEGRAIHVQRTVMSGCERDV
ncbi:hypothetical protein ASD21_19895 [Caulobacter sp. Root1455]|nr:hypothetical protein ASD21_19895 [Caulobacter sp. Root1455]